MLFSISSSTRWHWGSLGAKALKVAATTAVTLLLPNPADLVDRLRPASNAPEELTGLGNVPYASDEPGYPRPGRIHASPTAISHRKTARTMIERSLGFRLIDPDLEETFRSESAGGHLIGHIHGEEFEVVEREDGAVVVVDAASGEVSPLNRDRRRLDEFLAAYDEYVSAGPAATPAVVRSAAEMSARLAQMRAGALKPAARPAPTLSHKARYTALKTRWMAADRDALRDGTWWSGVLEQVKDGLL